MSVLTEAELPDPEAGPGQITIDTSHAAVGLINVLLRRGDMAKRPGLPQPPFGDGGNAFLKIMRGFELTRAKQNFFIQGLRSRPYPAHAVWGQRDRMLGDDHARAAQDALTVDTARAAARAPFPSGRPSPRRRDSCRQLGAPKVIHRSSDAARRSLKTVETTPIKGAD